MVYDKTGLYLRQYVEFTLGQLPGLDRHEGGPHEAALHADSADVYGLFLGATRNIDTCSHQQIWIHLGYLDSSENTAEVDLGR